MFKRGDEIRQLYDEYNRNYDVEEMLLLDPEIKRLKETYKEISFIKDFDHNMIFENYQEVFESEYEGDRSSFTNEDNNAYKDI